MGRKKFNATGLCIPDRHYMVDVSEKINQIIKNYIDTGEYFTINRARQYGKTTTLFLLWLALKERYVVINISFEGKEEYFSSLQAFANGLNISFHKVLKREHPLLADIFSTEIPDMLAMEKFADRITMLCDQAGQSVLLMIDEVDRAADNDVFLAFLGMLRQHYLNRAFHGEATFTSVILSGVHDIKNLENRRDFRNLVEAILLQGEDVSYVISNPEISRGVMYGIFKNEDGRVKISNRIFESYIYEYLISVNRTRQFVAARYTDKQQYIENGKLNMETVLKRFSAFMKSEYRDEDGKFIEQHGRLLFLSFLRPIINGTGHYAVESETRRNTRMDIQVFYGSEEFICELKIWHGEKKEMEAYDQLAGYFAAKGARRGYLLSFCDNPKSPRKDQTIRYKGIEIFEVIVSYRDKN